MNGPEKLEEKRDHLDFATLTTARPIYTKRVYSKKKYVTPLPAITLKHSIAFAFNTNIYMYIHTCLEFLCYSLKEFIYEKLISENRKKKLTFPVSSSDDPCPSFFALVSMRDHTHLSSETSPSERTMFSPGFANRLKSSMPNPPIRPETGDK